MTDVLWLIAISTTTILGSLLILSVAIRQFTTHDAVSRVNSIGPATTPGIPLIAIGAFLGWTWQEGFSWELLVKTGITVLAAMFVSSVATSVLARAAYMSGAPIDPRTTPNHLAEEPTYVEDISFGGVPRSRPTPRDDTEEH